MSQKVMIVDDAKTLRQQVNFTLTKEGYQVIEAETGKDGIEKLKENPDIALIISDLNMPIIDGIEMILAINGNPELPHPPIMMLTTEGATEAVNRAKAAGAKGWIVKPFHPAQLLEVVKKLLG